MQERAERNVEKKIEQIQEEIEIDTFDGSHLIFKNTGINSIELRKSNYIMISIYDLTDNTILNEINNANPNDGAIQIFDGGWVDVVEGGSDLLLESGDIFRTNDVNFQLDHLFRITTSNGFVLEFQNRVEEISLTANPDTVLANGIDTTDIVATVKDSFGNPAQNIPVTLTTTHGTFSNGLQQIVVNSDVMGIAIAVLTSPEDEVTALETAEYRGVTGKTNVNFRGKTIRKVAVRAVSDSDSPGCTVVFIGEVQEVDATYTGNNWTCNIPPTLGFQRDDTTTPATESALEFMDIDFELEASEIIPDGSEIVEVYFEMRYRVNITGNFNTDPASRDIRDDVWIYIPATGLLSRVGNYQLSQNYLYYYSLNLASTINTSNLANYVHIRVYYDPPPGVYYGIFYLDWARLTITYVSPPIPRWSYE